MTRHHARKRRLPGSGFDFADSLGLPPAPVLAGRRVRIVHQSTPTPGACGSGPGGYTLAQRLSRSIRIPTNWCLSIMAIRRGLRTHGPGMISFARLLFDRRQLPASLQTLDGLYFVVAGLPNGRMFLSGRLAGGGLAARRRTTDTETPPARPLSWTAQGRHGLRINPTDASNPRRIPASMLAGTQFQASVRAL